MRRTWRPVPPTNTASGGVRPDQASGALPRMGVRLRTPNRSALLAFSELYRAAEAIGETSEVERLRKLLLDSDPSDPLGVGQNA